MIHESDLYAHACTAQCQMPCTHAAHWRMCSCTCEAHHGGADSATCRPSLHRSGPKADTETASRWQQKCLRLLVASCTLIVPADYTIRLVLFVVQQYLSHCGHLFGHGQPGASWLGRPKCISQQVKISRLTKSNPVVCHLILLITVTGVGGFES